MARLQVAWDRQPLFSSGAHLERWQFWWGFHHDEILERAFSRDDRSPDSGARAEIIAALDNASDEVAAADFALARFGHEALGPETTQRLRRRLREALSSVTARGQRDDYREGIELTTLALGLLGGAESALILEALAGDTSTGRRLMARDEVPRRCRTFAVYALGVLGRRSESPTLRKEMSTRLLAWTLIGERLPVDVGVALVTVLGTLPLPWHADEEGTLDGSGLTQQMIQWLDVKAPLSRDFRVATRVAIAAARSLARTQAPFDAAFWEQRRALIEILNATHDKGPFARPEWTQSCIVALGHLAAHGAAHMASAPEHASETLALLADLKRIAADHPQAQARSFAIMGLSQAGRTAPRDVAQSINQFLVTGASAREGQQRPWMALGLGVLWEARCGLGAPLPEATRAALRAGLHSTEASDRVAYGLALGLVGDPSSEAHLYNCLGRGLQSAHRGTLLLALALLQRRTNAGPDSTKIGELLAEDELRQSVLAEGALALSASNDARTAQRLGAILRHHPASTAQAAGARALVHCQGGIAAALELLNDANATPQGRSLAAKVLGRACDPHARAWNAPFIAGWNHRVVVPTIVHSHRAGLVEIL